MFSSNMSRSRNSAFMVCHGNHVTPHVNGLTAPTTHRIRRPPSSSPHTSHAFGALSAGGIQHLRAHIVVHLEHQIRLSTVARSKLSKKIHISSPSPSLQINQFLRYDPSDFAYILLPFPTYVCRQIPHVAQLTFQPPFRHPLDTRSSTAEH